MPAGITERELTAARRKTLCLWPGARVAVQFGSRARGTAHRDSDRDVAIVLESGELRHPRPARSVFPRSELPADLPQVDVWILSEKDPCRNSRALGTLPCVICRECRVLAGEWSGPDPARIQHEAAIKPQDCACRMELVVTKIDAAITQIEKTAASGT